MLFAALGATVIGFVLLIVALVTANVWLAIGCVAVSVVGVVLLLIDVLTYRRAERDDTNSVDTRAGTSKPVKAKAAPARRQKASVAADSGEWSPGPPSPSAESAAAADTAPAPTSAPREDTPSAQPPGADRDDATVVIPAVVETDDQIADNEITAVVPRIDPDADAAREAATVGREDFGHHDQPPGSRSQGPGQQGPGQQGPGQQWSQESPATTDGPAAPTPGPVKALGPGILAPGKYDSDMTDQLPQIEIDRAWGGEWEPPEDPENPKR